MRDDVVDALARRQLAAITAHAAQRVAAAEVSRRAQPLIGVALLLPRAASLIVRARAIDRCGLTERAVRLWHRRH